MANFDLSSLALSAVCPGNEILYDDKNMPSISGQNPETDICPARHGRIHCCPPAFIVNGQEVDAIWISKYQNIVRAGERILCQTRIRTNSLNLETTMGYCTAKGAGCASHDTYRWGLLIQWCEKRIHRRRNNNYGKHGNKKLTTRLYLLISAEARPAALLLVLDHYHGTMITHLQGLQTSAVTYRSGWAVFVLFTGLQILANNNGADSSHSQLASGLEWKAIKADDGSLITPDGTGTTAGSVKMDYISSKLTYSTSITDAARGEHSCTFGNITCDATISDAAKLLLQSIGMLAYNPSGLCASHMCYFNNNEAERSFYSGGGWDYSSVGVASFNGGNPRSSAYASIGFRSAFVVLPPA